VELGQRYASDAVVDDGTSFPTYTEDPELHYHPTTHPGAALPHAWLGRDTHDVSTLDLCAYDRFTLITGADGADWEKAAITVGTELGVEIRPFPVALGPEYNDVLGTWTRAREVTDQGCVLVRPDHFVAWRSDGRASDPVDALRATMHRVLGLTTTES
jgi:2,4-dichlorophenol 6-monooxygenase